MFLSRPGSLFLAVVISCLVVTRPAELTAETLPDQRPALMGFGPGSLVNIINVDTLFQKGQRDGWVMFECGVDADGIVFGSDFFTASPDADLLKNEIRRRLRQTRFIPAVYNHKRTSAWFEVTAVFLVANGRPHLRLYAHQELDEIKHGSDFVAPQLIYVPNRDFSNFPNYPTAARHAEVGAVIKLRHSVDANGNTTEVRVISEHPAGYQLGEYLTKVIPRLAFLPGYLNGPPTATSYTLTWWFGHTIGW